MSMRAQISLQFTDSDLYDNFILPYKEQRVLNSIIVKCLSAYYYNEEARGIIEGTSSASIDGLDEVKSSQSIFDEIRASLVMQDYFAAELEATIAEGTEDIDSILNRTNEAMENSGVVRPSESEYGAGVYKVGSDVKQIAAKEAKQSGSDDSGHLEGIVRQLLEAVKVLARSSGNTEVESILGSDINISSEEVPENPSLEPVKEVFTEQKEIKAVSVPIETDIEQVVEVTATVEEDGEAADAMDDLLSSLGF